MAEKMVMVYNLKSENGMQVPESHVKNYVGKGYSKAAPKKDKKES